MQPNVRCGVFVASVLGLVIAAHGASHPTAIYQSTGVGPNAGIDGFQFSGFERLFKSGTGNWWALRADTASNGEILITGQDAIGAVRLTGQTIIEPGRVMSQIGDRFDINASGRWAATGRLSGSPNSNDMVLISGDVGGSISIPFREGQAVSAGYTLGNGSFAPSITDDGRFSFGYAIAGQPNGTNVGYFTDNGNSLVLQEGVSVPADQAGGTAFNYQPQEFGMEMFQTTSDGSSYVAAGELSNGDRVMIKDGSVVLQYGQTYSGHTLLSFEPDPNVLQDNGDWIVRANSGFSSVVLRNGLPLAAEDDLVGGSLPGERWSYLSAYGDNTFFTATGDSQGNTVVGGFTDTPNPQLNAVWLYNGVEFMRDGDQLDLDGDGQLDDAYIDFYQGFARPTARHSVLADDGIFYTTVDVRDGKLDHLGTAFIAVSVPGPGGVMLFGLVALTARWRRR